MARGAVEDIIRFLRDVASDENMRVTVKESVKGGCIAGGAAALGGLIAGPIGLAVGGAVGGLVAATTSSSFKPVAQIIYEMPPHQRERLANQITVIMERNQINNVAALAALIGAGGAIRNEVIRELNHFVTNELQLALA